MLAIYAIPVGVLWLMYAASLYFGAGWWLEHLLFVAAIAATTLGVLFAYFAGSHKW